MGDLNNFHVLYKICISFKSLRPVTYYNNMWIYKLTADTALWINDDNYYTIGCIVYLYKL